MEYELTVQTHPGQTALYCTCKQEPLGGAIQSSNIRGQKYEPFAVYCLQDRH